MTATVRDLRDRNKAAVLRWVLRDGATTRGRLANACGLSAATVTNVVADLVRDGLLQESGSIPSEGGRPRARISVVADGLHLIGAQVGEDGVTAELFDLSLTRLKRTFEPLDPRNADPQEMADAVLKAVREVRADEGANTRPLWAVGLGLPGIVEHDEDGDATLHAQSLGWEPVAVSDMFSELGVPLFVENSAKTLAMAELWFGAARTTREAVVALVGRGVGGALVADGRLQVGAVGGAGEIGHMTISVDGAPCHCGDRGCLEAYVGGGAIAHAASLDGRDGGSDEEVVAALVSADAQGDPAAAAILDDAARMLGIGLSNVINMCNPERVVVGGWAGLHLLSARHHEIESAMREHALRRLGANVSLVRCAFEDAIPLGAALLALDSFIEKRGTARVSA